MVEFNTNCGDGNPMLYHWVGSGANCRGWTEEKGWSIKGGQKPVASSSESAFDKTTGQFTFELKDQTRAHIGTHRVFIFGVNSELVHWTSYYYSWLIEIADPCTKELLNSVH